MILASEAKQISDASLEVYVKSFVKDLMAEVLPKIIEAAKMGLFGVDIPMSDKREVLYMAAAAELKKFGYNAYYNGYEFSIYWNA
jgi:hypothetical protein